EEVNAEAHDKAIGYWRIAYGSLAAFALYCPVQLGSRILRDGHIAYGSLRSLYTAQSSRAVASCEVGLWHIAGSRWPYYQPYAISHKPYAISPGTARAAIARSPSVLPLFRRDSGWT